MDNPLFLADSSPAIPGTRHRSHDGRPRQHLLARYFAAEKIRAIIDRLQEPAASYNRLVCGEAAISQAMSIFLVLQLHATADVIKLRRAEALLEETVRDQDDTNDEDTRSRARRQFRVQLAVAYVNVLFAIAITLFLTRVLAPEWVEVAALEMGLTATSQLVMLESREHEFFSSWTSTSLLKTLPLIRFDPLRSGDGHDCAICHEDIGEQEWIYPIPCKHQYHR